MSDFEMTAEQREVYEKWLAHYRAIIQPEVDAIRRSEQITAEDLAITINARDDDL